MYYNEFDGSTNRRSINDTTKLKPVKKSITPIVYVKPINTQPFEYETPSRTSKYDNSMTNKTQFYKYRQDIVQFLQQTQPNINLLNKSLTYEVYNYNDPEYLKQVEGARRNGLDAKSIALIYKPPKKMVYSTMKEAADSLTGLMGYLQKLTTTDAVQTAADKKVIKDLIDKTVKEAQADEIKKNEDFLKEIRDKQTYDLIPTVRPIPTELQVDEILDVKGDYVFDDTRLNQFMVDNETILRSDNLKQYNIAYGLALYNLMKEYYIYYTLQGTYDEIVIMNDLYNKMDNVVNPKILQDTYMYIEKNQQLKYTNVEYDPYYTLPTGNEIKKLQNDFYKLMEDFITNITNKTNMYDLASSDEEENKSVNLNPPNNDDEDLGAIGGPAVQPLGPQPAGPQPQPTPPQPAQPTPPPTPPAQPTPQLGPQPAGPAQPDPLLLPPAQPQPDPNAGQPPPQPDIYQFIDMKRLNAFGFKDYKDANAPENFLMADGGCFVCLSSKGHTQYGKNKHIETDKHITNSAKRLRQLQDVSQNAFDVNEANNPSKNTPIQNMIDADMKSGGLTIYGYEKQLSIWYSQNAETYSGRGMQDGQGVKVVYIQPKKNSTMKSNGWLKHVKEISDREKISWSAALKKAKLTYKK
jgi:hypothetical protein